MSVFDYLTKAKKGSEAIQNALADPYGTANIDSTLEGGEGSTNGEEVQTGQNMDPNLASRLDRLEQELANERKRNADKDRYIGELKGQVETVNQVFERFPNLAGSAPDQDSDPDEIDEDTLSLFEAKFEKDPARAMADMMAYHRQKVREDLERTNAQRRAEESSRTSQEEQRQKLARVEAHIWNQLEQAVETYGPAAEELREDLRVNQENSVIGQAIQQDPYLPLTQTGVFDFVSKNVNDGQSSGQGSPGVRGVARPQAPRRDLSPRNQEPELSEEDRIRLAIRNAKKPTSTGSPSARRRFLGSEL